MQQVVTRQIPSSKTMIRQHASRLLSDIPTATYYLLLLLDTPARPLYGKPQEKRRGIHECLTFLRLINCPLLGTEG
jgi:hypothetical protein